jgi:DNA-binding transcriptional MerR regulator
MMELYSIRDAARILALPDTRLRYWMQTGFVGPTVRKGGRFYYTFCDLIATKSAKDLLDAGLTVQKIRKHIDAVRRALPEETSPISKLRICCDGETIVVLGDDVAFEPIGGQIVMAFNVPSFGEHVTSTLAMPRVEPVETPMISGPTPQAIEGDSTEANGGITAYRYFVEACAAEDRGESEAAEHLFRQAIDLEPSMAAALTNLGNLMYRQGEAQEARRFYERALEADPVQPEARYNLANLLEDLGEVELAVAELRRVCAMSPEFADAHYNLGIMLAQLGGSSQARTHLERYLELDGQSDWAGHAREFLAHI